ncbi:hypothetical protein ACERZ8_14395 [Tateyamaria armeniaca]|uniref:Uncharacterized protein n=1 Tax=Tateyamaria armeniaca TaxID=2518930 RepID=A0ABW8UV38_9RHOB
MADDVCHACFGSKRTYQLPETFWATTVGGLLCVFAVAVAVF